MSVYFNGQKYSKVYYNGQTYTKLYYNGVNYLEQKPVTKNVALRWNQGTTPQAQIVFAGQDIVANPNTMDSTLTVKDSYESIASLLLTWSYDATHTQYLIGVAAADHTSAQVDFQSVYAGNHVPSTVQLTIYYLDGNEFDCNIITSGKEATVSGDKVSSAYGKASSKPSNTTAVLVNFADNIHAMRVVSPNMTFNPGVESTVYMNAPAGLEFTSISGSYDYGDGTQKNVTGFDQFPIKDAFINMGHTSNGDYPQLTKIAVAYNNNTSMVFNITTDETLVARGQGKFLN
jgi:hypothetical protein